MHFRIVNFGLLLILTGLLLTANRVSLPDMPVSVTFFSAERGESILIDGPEVNILADSSGSPSIVPQIAAELEGEPIDIFLISHPHADHIGGASAILERFNVGQIWLTGVEYDSAGYRRLLNQLPESRTKYVSNSSDMRLGGFEIDVLHPMKSLQGAGYSSGDINDTSVVTQISYHDFDLLLTGDISSRIESALTPRLSSSIEVLKVAHQGSYTSSDERFLSVIKPEIAVISVGKDNPYGHPHQQTLTRLQSAGAYIFRTDLNGKIKILTDGSKIFAVPERVRANTEMNR